MATTSPLQGFAVPQASDSPDGATQMTNLAKGIEQRVVMVFASAAARTSAFTAAGVSPAAGQLCWRSDGAGFEGYSGAFWVPQYPSSANVDTSQTTTSLTYTDLATSGPAVTVVTGTAALVMLTGYIFNSSASFASYIGCAISGASTVAATNARAAAGVGDRGQTPTMIYKVTGLTAGSNTFTAKYGVSGGTGTFANRNITVWPLFS